MSIYTIDIDLVANTKLGFHYFAERMANLRCPLYIFPYINEHVAQYGACALGRVGTRFADFHYLDDLLNPIVVLNAAGVEIMRHAERLDVRLRRIWHYIAQVLST